MGELTGGSLRAMKRALLALFVAVAVALCLSGTMNHAFADDIETGDTQNPSEEVVDDGTDQGATEGGDEGSNDASDEGSDDPAEDADTSDEADQLQPTGAGWYEHTDGSWYWFTDPAAEPATGWVQVGKNWYWMQPDANGLMAASQFVDDNGTRYYVNADGAMQTGWFQVDGDWYYANRSGAIQTGWLLSGGKWYWLLPAEGGKMALNQWIENDGVRYYLTDKGPGQMATGWFRVNGDWYYANKSGAQQMSGWVKSGSKWYWLLADQDGKMAIDQWVNYNGTDYYLTDKGPGQMATGWFQIDGDWYYANGSGAHQKAGWVKSGKSWYWLQGDQNGKMLAGDWIEDGGQRYFLTNDGPGKMATGWFHAGSDDWYYAEGSGALVQNGWKRVGGAWYWLQGDKAGVMFANGTKEIDGATYSFADNGAMHASCLVNLGDGVARYAMGSGALASIGVYQDDQVVLTNDAGEPVSGWVHKAGRWFYGQSGTGIIHTGWLKLGNTWYFLDGNGAMVTGNRYIDGKMNIFNGSGVWLGTDLMSSKAQGYSSGTPWLILVDRGAHKVAVFNGHQGNWTRTQTFSCVTGAGGSPTITGVFRTTGGKRMNLSTDSRARWCTQISGGYFFHTILASESELGQSLSHGCIRLAVPNAQWIYNNIGAGTTVVIYN